MPRTSLTPILAPGSYPTVPTLMAFTACDVANGNQVAMSGKDLLVIFNNDAAPQTVTINSVPDAYGRAGDITAFSMAAGTYYIVGPLSKLAWAQAAGVLFLAASTVTVKFAVIQIPN